MSCQTIDVTPVWDYYPHSRYGERVSIPGDIRPAA